MLCGYAIGMGAGTQALILMTGEMIAGKPSVFSRAVLMGAAWVINLAGVYFVILLKLRVSDQLYWFDSSSSVRLG